MKNLRPYNVIKHTKLQSDQILNKKNILEKVT